MRNFLTTAAAASLCALTVAAPLSGAEPQGKIDNPGRLDWLELRTMFAASEGPVLPSGKTNQRSSALLDTVSGNESGASHGLELFRPDLDAAWDLVRQQAQFAAKFTSKRLGSSSAGNRTAPELSWGWQHES
jgi:hypothetical protein